jgi:hypothetical protein
MSGEIAKLKAELEALNLQCQLARDHEVRYALQRSRLEAERVKLLIRLYDASPTVAPNAAEAVAPTVAAPATPESIPDATLAAPSVSKPHGLPSVPEMILQALVDATDGLRPRDITQTIRREWWCDMPADRVPVTAFRMAKEGRLAKDGNRYKLLNRHGGGEP